MEEILGITIRPIERKEAEEFVLKKHYLKQWPQGVYQMFGIFLNDSIIGIIIYGKPMAEHMMLNKFGIPLIAGNIIELKRLFINDVDIKNLESYVISRANKEIKRLRPTTLIIISYADQTVGHSGIIYKATNAIYMGMNKDGKHLYAYPMSSKHQNRLVRHHFLEKE